VLFNPNDATISAMRRVSIRDRLRMTRSNLQAGVVDRMVHAFAKVRWRFPDAQPERYDTVLLRDVPYRETGDASHTLDVYLPTRAAKPLPTVLYVHGGGFSMLSKETHRGMALSYARRGFLVFIINYRLGPRHRFPAPLEDASLALQWVHAHCARFGGDPDRIALAGESAGGNLVTALAVASSVRRPEPYAQRLFDAGVPIRAVISTYGFLDLEGYTHHMAHPRLHAVLKDVVLHCAASYVGVDVRAGCAANPLASPLAVLEQCDRLDRPLPPFFADVGTRDILISDSRRLQAAVERLGSTCVLHIAPGEIHGYDAMLWRPEAKRKWRAATAFLGQHLARTDGVPEADDGADAIDEGETDRTDESHARLQSDVREIVQDPARRKVTRLRRLG
jgi:acetyl esterase